MKDKLIKEAKKILGTFQLNTYPSNYAGKVATALLTKKGNIYTGISVNLACNVGNCGEHAAIVEMLKNRETEIEMIVSLYEGDKVIPPCGRCREMLMQLDNNNKNTIVIIDNHMNTLLLYELLPHQWNS